MSETRVVHVNDGVDGAVYIGRYMPPAKGRRLLPASRFANQFKIGTVPWWADRPLTRADAIEAYRKHLLDHPAFLDLLIPLRGKPLACWCRHDGEAKTEATACHGDVLIEILDRYTDDELREMAKP